MITRKNELGFFDSFNSLFNEALAKEMRTDIEENDNQYLITMDIPGVDKKDIDISVLDGAVTISVNKTKNEEDKNKNYIIRERSLRSVSRSFYLNDICEDTIKAKYENGILTLVVNKLKPIEEPKKTIAIE